MTSSSLYVKVQLIVTRWQVLFETIVCIIFHNQIDFVSYNY